MVHGQWSKFFRKPCSETCLGESRYCFKSLAERLLIIDLIGLMEEGVFDRRRKPNPISAKASSGLPAISPQSAMGLLGRKELSTKLLRKEREADERGSNLSAR